MELRGADPVIETTQIGREDTADTAICRLARIDVARQDAPTHEMATSSA